MYYIENNDERIDVAEVEKDLNSFLSYLNETRDFSLSFISDDEIQSLNNEYRGIDSPTDILTFAINDGEEFPSFEGEDEELGDVFISIDSMERNAKEFGVSPEEELKRLLLHGLLHLRGMDHKTNDFNTEPMLIEQERILKQIGILH